MYDKAKDKVEEFAGKGQEAFGKATDDDSLTLEGKIHQKAAQASYTFNDYVDSVKEKTSKDPVPAQLIAGGVGFLLAKILGSSRR
ncbi:MAG: CsbD family protein [Sodalis sp. (in: enterobacteria)]|uniref:CsbD family protein n=1 Tax=Sodalis sp. (in: enterobacteria) TaxID=1898979 RepID=UPI0039E57078